MKIRRFKALAGFALKKISAVSLGVAAIAILGVPLASASGVKQESFTVADSIGMARIADPELPNRRWLPSKHPKFRTSPDGRKFLVVVRRGNLATGLNEYSLLVYDVDAVLAYVRHPGDALPTADVLARFSTDSASDAIDQVAWMQDSHSVAFIGRRVGKPAQVYVAELDTKRLVQMTNDPGDVIRFGITQDRSRIAYAARIIPDLSAVVRYGRTITSEKALALAEASGEEVYPRMYAYFVLNTQTGERAALGLTPTWFPQHISVSPTEHKAIVAHPVARLPERWQRYEFVRQRIARESAATSCAAPTLVGLDTGMLEGVGLFGTMSDVGQLYVVDLDTARVRPLVDAPIVIPAVSPITKFGGWDRGAIAWSPDNKRVLLPPNLLPADISDPAERTRREKALAIYTVELESASVSIVSDLANYTSIDNPQGMPILPFAMVTSGEWLSGDTVEVSVSGSDGTGGIRVKYKLRQGAWKPEANARAERNTHGTTQRIRLDVRQDANTPPDIFATDPVTGKSARITDLNPAFRNVGMPHVTAFEWTDRTGRRLRGGLFLPPEFVAGEQRRYPVVIQLGGFTSDEFQVDGPAQITSAMAARPLASQGMLVLQAPNFGSGRALQFGCAEPPSDSTTTEAALVIAGIEGAIDELDRAGLIDRSRVGLLGFSRTGMHVHEFITFSRYKIAAATVADSVAMSPATYARAYGGAFPGMLEFESAEVMGAPFFGDGVKSWQDRSYLFHLDKIRTPIRYEHNYAMVAGHWDTYAILRRMGRPVEFVHFPVNSHILETPDTRYTSQQGNVDWFSFWLMGKERTPTEVDRRRPGGGLEEQYLRWRELRRLHNLINIGASSVD